jgi:mannose-6-phosphate isomerase-like protein (cupin superfamily)
MAIVTERAYKPVAAVGDPDDYRPHSSMAFVFDPERADGAYVAGLTLICEEIAVGDRIPLHIHPTVEEIVFIDSGTAQITVGEEQRIVGAGAVAFIPPGTPHETRNIGTTALHLHAIFPTPVIDIAMIDRIPAPGTEADAPQPAASVNLRAGWS